MDSKTIISIVTTIIILSGLYYLVKGIDESNDRKIVEVEKVQKKEAAKDSSVKKNKKEIIEKEK